MIPSDEGMREMLAGLDAQGPVGSAEPRPPGSVEVTRVTVRIGDRDIEMTVEQARTLRDRLDALFGPYHHGLPYIPVPYPAPYPAQDPLPATWKGWEIYCNADPVAPAAGYETATARAVV